MFICHKCGYKDLTDNKKTNCPICGANVIVPKVALVLFLSFVLYIVFTFLSMFNDKLNTIAVMSLIVAVISVPFAIKEAIKRKNEIKEGFRAPDSPDEIINGNPRVPDFKYFDYVYGLKDDEGVKKILLETYKDGLNVYYNKLREIETINYEDIVGLEIHEENELKMSTSKSVVYGALLGLMGGLGAGLIGGTIGGIENKNRHVLEIQVKHNDEINSLYITENKSQLINFAKEIEDKVNGK